MQGDKVYILNPAYFLRNDVHRAIIGTFEFSNMPIDMYDAHVLYRIPPEIAKCLSFFTKDYPLSKVIEHITNYWHISHDAVKGILEPMLENETPIEKEMKGDKIYLPKYLLVEKASNERKETYAPDDFEINSFMDLTSVRLYRPIHAILELTMQCYTNCIYCYTDRKSRRNAFLRTSDVLKFIDEAHKLQFTDIEVNGGEILLHPGIKAILQKLAGYGYYPLISTKLPLTEDWIEYLKNLKMKRIQISIDSLRPEIESALLRVDSSYVSRMLDTMHLLDKYEFSWQANIVLTKLNCHPDVITELIQHLLEYRHIIGIKLMPMGYPMYKQKDTFAKIAPSLHQIEAVRDKINELEITPTTPIFFGDIDKICNYTNKSWEIFQERPFCTANQKAFNVLPDGKVTICEELYWHPAFIIGDITKSSIEEIWNSERATHLFYLQQEKVSANSKCRSCEMFEPCRHTKQVCWKMVIMANGMDCWDFPDPRCPLASIPTKYCYV